MIDPIGSRRQFLRVAAVVMIVTAPVALPGDSAVHPVPNRHDAAGQTWPMFGGGPDRNMVNAVEQKLPLDWCIAEGKHKNIKWVAELGDRTIGSPVVAEGKVFIATNNAKPRHPGVQGHKAVIMAFREADGQFLWQIAHDLPKDWNSKATALPSTPAVIGGRLYYVTSAGEVVCADADQGKIQWRYDMSKELDVHGYQDWCGARPAPTWSSPLVIGNHVFVATGNGIAADGKLVSPKAPAFIALDKRTGKLVWQSNLPGENTIEGHWSSAAYTDHGGRPQVIFAGGDGVIYSFVPETGKLLWKCDCLPERGKAEKGIDNQFIGTPVVVGDKLYIGLGTTPEHARGTSWSYFLCLDITRKGDVSLKSYNAKAVENKGSALVWAFGGPLEPRPEKGPSVYFGSTVSTAAVDAGLVYITEASGYLHCLDAATGSRAWVYDLWAASIGSPYVADGRVYVGTEDGEILVFGHQRAARVRATIDMEASIHTTPVAANGTLYVATWSKLYAISER
jgi:outer membrane protein assembly factor BamB